MRHYIYKTTEQSGQDERFYHRVTPCKSRRWLPIFRSELPPPHSRYNLCVLSNKITNSMEQMIRVPQLVKKFLALYGTRRFVRIEDSPPSIRILSQIYVVHKFPKEFFNIQCNIILPSMSKSSKWSLSFRFSPPKPCTHLSSTS
jgi:hypothetical protein